MALIPPDIDDFFKKKLAFAHGSDLTNVPDTPGIYAWFAPFPFRDLVGENIDPNDEQLSEKYSKAAKDSLAAYRELFLSAGDVGPHNVTIGQRPAKISHDEDHLKSILQTDKRTRAHLSHLFLAFSIFSPPLYVGMTNSGEGLQGRLYQHLTSPIKNQKNLRSRLYAQTNNKNQLKQCIVAFAPLSDDDFPNNNVARFIEHVLIQIINPIQSKRG